MQNAIHSEKYGETKFMLQTRAKDEETDKPLQG